MAENLKDAASPGHNSGNISDEEKMDLIRKLDEDLSPIEREMEALNNKKKDLRRDFKKITGIVQADFNGARRLALIEDEDEQKAKTDNLELCFNALSQNSQLSFFDSVETSEE